MKNNKLAETLSNIGLSDLEAEVYLTMLSLGPTTVLKIAQASGVKRTSIYHVVESLKQTGLVTIEVKGFKQLYLAEHPEKLESIINIKKEELIKNLPEFEAIYNLKSKESTIKYYEGVEGCKNAYEGLIRDAKADQFYYVFSNTDMWYKQDPKYYTDFLNRRAKKGIRPKSLYQYSKFAQELKSKIELYQHKIKFLPEEVVLETNLVIIPRRVIIHRVNPPIMAVMIENKSIVQMFKVMFEIIWNSIS